MTRRKDSPVADTERLLTEADRYEEDGNLKRAFECLLEGALLGDSGCQINVGNYYSSGKGVRRNPKEAARWYIKAYKNGTSGGALNLAIDRRDSGRIRSAVIWLKKAIEMDNGDACIELAKIYKTRRNMEAAADLLRRAVAMDEIGISEYSRDEAAALLLGLDKTHGVSA